MIELISGPVILVHIASLLYVVAFLVKDQLVLRCLVLIATVLYVIYYYAVPDTPLWDAIVWSLILGVANLWATLEIVLSRTTLAMTDDEKMLYSAFDDMLPGEFRKLLKITKWNDANEPVVLTTENQHSPHLFYVMSGQIDIRKQDRDFNLNSGIFIGEVGYLLKTHASATVTIGAGARYVSWHITDLRELQRRSPGIRTTIYELINKDMADKVAASSA